MGPPKTDAAGATCTSIQRTLGALHEHRTRQREQRLPAGSGHLGRAGPRRLRRARPTDPSRQRSPASSPASWRELRRPADPPARPAPRPRDARARRPASIPRSCPNASATPRRRHARPVLPRHARPRQRRRRLGRDTHLRDGAMTVLGETAARTSRPSATRRLPATRPGPGSGGRQAAPCPHVARSTIRTGVCQASSVVPRTCSSPRAMRSARSNGSPRRRPMSSSTGWWSNSSTLVRKSAGRPHHHVTTTQVTVERASSVVPRAPGRAASSISAERSHFTQSQLLAGRVIPYSPFPSRAASAWMRRRVDPVASASEASLQEGHVEPACRLLRRETG